MSDQLSFEMRLDAAIKLFAADADGAVDATRIAATALGASQSAGWRARLASIALPQAPSQTGLSPRLLVVALMAILAFGAVGFGLAWQRGMLVGPPPTTLVPTIVPTIGPTAEPTVEPTVEPVLGWPGTGENPPGVYSWDGYTCARWRSCIQGFMHNAMGSGPGNIDILVRAQDVALDPDLATAVTVAGHDGLYLQSDLPNERRQEEWVVEIDGTTVHILLVSERSASEAELADAHAIIDSLRYEQWGKRRGFRLVFTLTNDHWDSG